MFYKFIEHHKNSFLSEDEQLFNINFTQDGLQIIFVKDEKKFINFVSWKDLLNFINTLNGYKEYKGDVFDIL